jgi:hypothetical protein
MVGAQDGGMERQRNLILPERPQRGYWQFLYKYPSKYPNTSFSDLALRGFVNGNYGSGDPTCAL